MTTEPRIGFATLCRGRTFHLKQTLPRNLADAKGYPNAVFIVLDYGSQDDLIPYLKANHAGDIERGRLVVYSLKGASQFKLAHGKNVAMRCAMLEGATLACMLDADNFSAPGFAQFISDSFREPGIRPGIFLCPDYQLIKSLPHGALRPVRGYAGRLVVWSQTFVKVGGYCESFETWRGEDIDMNFRLQKAGYVMRHIPNNYLNAINHNAEVRFREYPHAQQQYENHGEIEVIKARTETVVNYGRFGLGTVQRNFCDREIKLDPLPTRIFGIGLHKTATTSLHKALQLLGLDSFHWGAGDAPLIWYEMLALGVSKTVEQWYALSDLPIPLLYEDLDRAYPGSKFILSVRNEVDWIRSVSRLWDHRYNPTRRLWDVYPFSHQIHTALYGRKDFDAVVFLQRYRRHNAQVKEYFKDRPEDLLILDIDTNPGWGALCRFLKLPVPYIPYPRSNQTPELISSDTF